MRKTRLFIFLMVCLMALPALAQTSKVTMTFKNESLPSVFKRLEKATDYKFLFAYEDVGKYTVNGEVKNASIQETMDYVLRDKPLTYTVEGKIVNVQSANEKKSGRMRTIKGYVRDDSGEPLMGVPVCIGETRVCTVTDVDGFYTFKIPVERTVLKFSYVGMDNKYETIGQGTNDVDRNIVMSSSTQLKDVVVTGIFNRKKESFTGSAATYNKDDLIQMGSSNVLQSLKTLDPAFAIIEDTQFGSDPNRLPNMEIRGKSSMLGQRDELATDPNQPLFILDGFESSLQAINDLDINRIESIT
ncbi:MAG: carboxypeptidase-like regulatory domain-containing protein, partial [Prevotella sp.]|nr:carboxypeptidase-like regulatory domain-containing protein [Prevotella sp.]